MGVRLSELPDFPLSESLGGGVDEESVVALQDLFSSDRVPV